MRMKVRSLGLTMLELVLVIAILMVLMATILSVASPARRAARMTSCTSNLRQIGMAYKMYLADTGVYPDPYSITHGTYISDRRVLVCPEDTSLVLQGVSSSYTYRYWVPPDFRPLTELPELDPNTVLVTCDHHMGRTIKHLGNDAVETKARYPYHLILRSSGSVQRIRADRLRTATIPAERPIFMDLYPDEPGYSKIKRGGA